MISDDLEPRKLKAVGLMAEHGSVSAAAAAMNRTQSALSRSLAELESQLGVSLFERHSRGAGLTRYGEVLLRRIREAEVQFDQASKAHLLALRRMPRQQHNPVFNMEISGKRLNAFLALHETRDIALAATQLGVTRAAIYDSIRVLQDLLELPLFETTANGLRSSTFADVLAVHIKLAFSLLQHGVDEVRSLDGELQGNLVVGTLPYARSVLVPRCIDRLLQSHPGLHIATREGPYTVLEAALRNGAIDLIVGATRTHDDNSPLLAETLFEDELAVICGAHHPLIKRTRLGVRELMDYGWVLPLRSTPARQLFDRFLQSQGVAEPKQIVETGSLSMARGLLLESNRLALLSSHQVQLDQAAGLLATLPIQLKETFRPIGITRRARSRPSPAALLFMDGLRALAQDISPSKVSKRGKTKPRTKPTSVSNQD